MIRGIVTALVEGVIKRFSATGRVGETFENREYLQHYGLTSRPLPGAELIILREGNNIIAVASDDRRYRLQLAEGEVALYDDQGQSVHLRQGGIIHIKALTKVTIDTPLLEVTGDITDGVRSMAADRSIYNAHNHPGDSGGTTGTPNQVM